jgi:phage terminase small subunit
VIYAALKNPRQEAFAQALARGMPTAKAYVDAGYKPNRGNACALKQAQNVSTRINEIQEEQLAHRAHH